MLKYEYYYLIKKYFMNPNFDTRSPKPDITQGVEKIKDANLPKLENFKNLNKEEVVEKLTNDFVGHYVDKLLARNNEIDEGIKINVELSFETDSGHYGKVAVSSKKEEVEKELKEEISKFLDFVGGDNFSLENAKCSTQIMSSENQEIDFENGEMYNFGGKNFNY